ncbi:MAG: hypothetical protein K0S11_52 [Gammaproteobacteria bacterium]|jgi:DNA repair protein RecO (recombination protein O)|nr:hypothetical protein [Gammaproteobacteria bacterium]
MNKLQAELEPGFILHTRAYRDTSLIVELFTQEYGRVPVVARGARGRKSWQGLLQPFVPVFTSWSGKEELMSLHNIEQNGIPYWLAGRKLLSGFYLNELLMRLLHRFDPHPELFNHYIETLKQLAQPGEEEYVLRLFEKRLLDELGYGLVLQHEALSDIAIEEQFYYRFEPQQGLIKVSNEAHLAPNVFAGKVLLAVAHENLTEAELPATKRLMRLALSELLGDKPLRTRELFAVPISSN